MVSIIHTYIMLFLHHIRRAITVAKSYDLVKKDVKENLVVL